MTMNSLFHKGLRSYQIAFQHSPLGCGGTGDSHQGCAAKVPTASWNHVNLEQSFRNVFDQTVGSGLDEKTRTELHTEQNRLVKIESKNALH